MDDASTALRIQVCYATPDRKILIDAKLPAGSTVQQAIKISGLLEQAPEIDLSALRVGIFGKLKSLQTALRDGDRVEIYRPLIADPMESRRRRAGKRRSKDGRLA